jgi:outer membrane protein
LAGVSGTTGVSPQLEISNAQTSLAQAESNVVNAIYDYNTARAQLDRATGRYSFVENGPGYKSPPKIAH